MMAAVCHCSDVDVGSVACEVSAAVQNDDGRMLRGCICVELTENKNDQSNKHKTSQQWNRKAAAVEFPSRHSHFSLQGPLAIRAFVLLDALIGTLLGAPWALALVV